MFRHLSLSSLPVCPQAVFLSSFFYPKKKQKKLQETKSGEWDEWRSGYVEILVENSRTETALWAWNVNVMKKPMTTAPQIGPFQSNILAQMPQDAKDILGISPLVRLLSWFTSEQIVPTFSSVLDVKHRLGRWLSSSDMSPHLKRKYHSKILVLFKDRSL